MNNYINKGNIVSKLIEKFIRKINNITSILMVVLTMIVFVEVVSRYVFNRPISFTNELTMVLFPWIAFLAAIEVTEKEAHLGLTFVRDALPLKGQKICVIITKLIMIVFSWYMIKSSFELSKAVIYQKLPVLQISKSYLYASVTVAFCGILLILIYQTIKMIFNNNNHKGEDI